jgi:hypothetical protein
MVDSCEYSHALFRHQHFEPIQRIANLMRTLDGDQAIRAPCATWQHDKKYCNKSSNGHC